MNTAIPSAESIVTRGKRVYDEKIRHLLEPAYNGQVVVVNIENGQFEVDPRHRIAAKRAQARWPNGLFYAVRVGFPTLGHMGGRFSVTRSEG